MKRRMLALALAALTFLRVVPGLAGEENRAEEILRDMTLEQKIYQMFIVTPEMLTESANATIAGDMTREALASYPVGGLIYFANNLTDRDQTTKMIQGTQDMARAQGMPALFIGVDEEGGSVARVGRKLGTTRFDSMMRLAGAGDPQLIYNAYQTIAGDIRRFGFNLDFAPVADVILNEQNTEIGDRAFGSDPEFVGVMAASAVRGLQDSGVIATLKHFPGHGSTQGNSHDHTTTSERTLEQMRGAEFLPFQAGIAAGADFVLMSHLTATHVDDALPASMSRTIVSGLLREALGFEGVVCTDALRMLAIADNYTSAEIAEHCVNAGVDILLMPADFQGTAQALLRLTQEGRISEARIDESVRRILRVKLKYGITA